MCNIAIPYLPTPTLIAGRAPISYGLLGVGASPFNTYYTIRVANSTELVLRQGHVGRGGRDSGLSFCRTESPEVCSRSRTCPSRAGHWAS